MGDVCIHGTAVAQGTAVAHGTTVAHGTAVAHSTVCIHGTAVAHGISVAHGTVAAHVTSVAHGTSPHAHPTGNTCAAIGGAPAGANAARDVDAIGAINSTWALSDAVLCARIHLDAAEPLLRAAA